MSRRDDVLVLLRGAGKAGASGERIATELGVSRAAIAKHVSVLRRAGYVIEAKPGLGYRLVSAPDTPTPAEVAPLVSSSFWVRFEGAAETGSTNDDARVLARAGAPEGTVVLAGMQSAGRGRLGRTWASPEGGAYLSLVLRPPLSPAQVAPLSLAIGLGVARALRGLGTEAMLKWPNDVVLPDGKVAGILLEMSAEADSVEWVVAGIGLNVVRPEDSSHLSMDPTASPSFVADRVDVTRRQVAAAVLDGVAEIYERFTAAGFASLADEWNGLDSLRGQDVVVRDAQGRVLASGRAEGVDDEGRLRVISADGVVPVPSGEVTLRDR